MAWILCPSLSQSIPARGMQWIDWPSLVQWLILKGKGGSQSIPAPKHRDRDRNTETETGERDSLREIRLRYPKGGAEAGHVPKQDSGV